MASRAVEGTRTRSQEHRRDQAVGWDRERWAAAVAHAEMKKTKKKKGRQAKDLFGCQPEERHRFIPVAPAGARPRGQGGVNQADNTTSPP